LTEFIQFDRVYTVSLGLFSYQLHQYIRLKLCILCFADVMQTID